MSIERDDHHPEPVTDSRLAPHVSSSLADAAECAVLLAEMCGPGSMLHIDCGDGRLMAALLERGVNAFGVGSRLDAVVSRSLRVGGRIFVGDPRQLPFADRSFGTVVSIDCLQQYSREDIGAVLREMRRLSARYVVLRVATADDGTGRQRVLEDRSWWEARCLEAGFRKHPLYYKANPFESLNAQGERIVVALEVADGHGLPAGRPDGDVQDPRRTDMLRAFGRRSDAHCVRYQRAAEFIRTGDRVLDVACGLGYGSHILYANSGAQAVLGRDDDHAAIAYAQAHYGHGQFVRFEAGDVQSLEGIPDHSIDFVTAFDALEYVPDPPAFLRALKRVLAPSGRLMISAPEGWSDPGSGERYAGHLHVYTWERLLGEVGAEFLLERAFVQTAGGGAKCQDAPRAWHEVPVGAQPSQQAEWALLLAMADPVSQAHIPYTETAWRLPEQSDFHVAAFGRDYSNPWLVRSMVSIGMRAGSQRVLLGLQQRVLEQAHPESVDYGAALCGAIYAALASEGSLPPEELERLHKDVQRYAAIQDASPHQLRWQVSLLFAVGELARRQGRWEDAAGFFEDCASRDIARYSPLLGNKVLDALYWLAVFAQSRGDLETARAHLRRSTALVQQWLSGSWINIVGLPEEPWPVGLAEAAQLLDKAARAAYMLSMLDASQARPGYATVQSRGFFERQLLERDGRLQNDVRVIDALHRAIADLQKTQAGLVEVLAATERRVGKLADEVQTQSALAQQMGKLAAERDAAAQDFARKLGERDAAARAFATELQQAQLTILRVREAIAAHPPYLGTSSNNEPKE